VLHGVEDVAVVEQDAGGLAAELERDVLEVGFGGRGHYGSSAGGAACKSNFGDLHVRCEQGAGWGGAGQDVDYAGGEAGLFVFSGFGRKTVSRSRWTHLVDQIPISSQRQRTLLARLEDERVASRHGRSHFPGRENVRAVPCTDAGANT
jgi:hypothetical protein